MKRCTSCNKELRSGRVICKECYTQLDEWKEKAKKYDEKETPKKFKIKTDKDGRVIWVCPKCGKILKKFWSEVETIRPFNYCDECGTALDWSDEDGSSQ